MKIVYCILGTFNSGGMERVLANKANYLINHGHEVTIITTDQQGRTAYFELNSNIQHFDLGINYTDNNNKDIFSKLFSYPQKQKLHRKKLTELLFKLQADITISMFDNDADFLYNIKDGSKKIVEIHFSRFKRIQYARKGIWKVIDQWRSNKDLEVVSKYDRFVVLTEEDKGYWGDLNNILVIPNANSFVPASTASLLSKKVIAVGRYDFQKGFEYLIQAWSLVHSRNSEWKLNIFGKGPLKENLQKQIDDANLSDSIKLCEAVKNIEKEYLDSSIVAMTSRYEGLPMVLLEGQSCGLPLVSFACKCGPRDLIEDGVNGYLIAENDITSFADKLIHLMENDKLRLDMGRSSVQKSKLFSEDVVMEKWLNLFKEIGH